MLDIKLIREQPDLVRENTRKRQPDKVKLVDEAIGFDKAWREKLQETEKLRHSRNAITLKISELKKKGKDAKALLEEAKHIPQKIAVVEAEADSLKASLYQHLLKIPNIMHESVPFGNDEKDNVEIRKHGKIPKFDFEPKSHVDLLQSLDLADTERAAKVAGSRFYYLKNQLVVLELALQRFALDILIKKGYAPLEVPLMLNRKVMEGVLDFSDFQDVIYKIEDDDLYMIGTSEHAIAGFHMDEVLDKSALPLKYCGISSCFRKEAGSHGKDTKGIFRVHQFNKAEQFVFSTHEQSWGLMEELIGNAEEIYKKLELPYRILNMCSRDIGATCAKKYDLEVWMPVQNCYRELVSCSNCTDYQARKLNIRYADGKDRKIVHTLNATAIATSRTIVAILENFQQKDGSVKIPKALHSYTGFKEIKKDLS